MDSILPQFESAKYVIIVESLHTEPKIPTTEWHACVEIGLPNPLENAGGSKRGCKKMANAILALMLAVFLAAGLRITLFLPFESSLVVLLLTLESGVIASAVNRLGDRMEELREKPKT